MAIKRTVVKRVKKTGQVKKTTTRAKASVGGVGRRGVLPWYIKLSSGHAATRAQGDGGPGQRRWRLDMWEPGIWSGKDALIHSRWFRGKGHWEPHPRGGKVYVVDERAGWKVIGHEPMPRGWTLRKLHEEKARAKAHKKAVEKYYGKHREG